VSFQLFPYTELQGTVDFEVKAVSLDGKDLHWQAIYTDQRIVELRSPDEVSWRVATIEIEVRGPAAELQSRSGDLSHVVSVAVVNCGPSNRREAVQLSEAGRALWKGSIELDRSEWFGQATIGCTLTATIEGVADRQAGFARSWTVRFDDLPPREVNNAMRITWVNFNNPTEGLQFLTEFADDVCYLRIEAGIEDPVLYLNDSFHGLRALLDQRPGRPKAHGALRTQVMTDIAARCWQALFMSAVQAIEADEDGTLVEPESEWQRNVLSALLPHVYPNLGLEDARAEAFASLEDSGSTAAMQERLLIATSRHVNQPKALREAIHNIAEYDFEEDH
jgi:hypothetical protein